MLRACEATPLRPPLRLCALFSPLRVNEIELPKRRGGQ
jgi:hypothetical protein